MKTVEPLDFEGSSGTFLQIFGKGPRFTIVCGGCRLTFQCRIAVVSDPPAPCPYCKAINILPLVVENV